MNNLMDIFEELESLEESQIVRIPLINSPNEFASVDEIDVDLLHYDWYLLSSGYVASNQKENDGWKIVYLHTMIALRKFGDIPEETDHEDRNKSNNRRYNIRLATSSQNKTNRILKKSIFRGVYKHRNKFQAQIRYHGIYKVLGSTFNNPKDAAIAYDKAAIELHGEFAVLNFPRSNYG